MATGVYPADMAVVPIFTFTGKEVDKGATVTNLGGPAIVIGSGNNPGIVQATLLPETQAKLVTDGEISLEEAAVTQSGKDNEWRLVETNLSADSSSSHALLVCALEGRGPVSYSSEGKAHRLRGVVAQRTVRNDIEQVVAFLPRNKGIRVEMGNLKYNLRFDGAEVIMTNRGSRR